MSRQIVVTGDAGFIGRSAIASLNARGCADIPYTRALCVWPLQHGARFAYASSAATYNQDERGHSDAGYTRPFTPLEDAVDDYIRCYGQTQEAA